MADRIAVALTHVRVWPVIAAGCLLLLARPWFAPSSPALAALYAALIAVSPVTQTPDDMPGPVLAPLLTGMAAIVLLRVLLAPVPFRQDGFAFGLDVLAAIAEEAFFRRLVYGAVERGARGGATAAILVSAGLFAIVHLPVYGVAAMAVDFGAGVLFGWQRCRSGRWTVPAATHVVANLLVVI